MVRTYNDCLTSPNLNEYLMALGFKWDLNNNKTQFKIKSH